ncbi:hypothetical protein GQ42DRAFT_156151 [Ramicandelaber brevisporus]|nr:hypothetical protein GQ42DRAFT_156151 [Ramicandelaber brevisporus]
MSSPSFASAALRQSETTYVGGNLQTDSTGWHQSMGSSNFGSICYSNACLQLIASTRPFAAAVSAIAKIDSEHGIEDLVELNLKKEFVKHLSSNITQLKHGRVQHSSVRSLDSRMFVEATSALAKHLRAYDTFGYKNCDARELLSFICRVIREYNNPIINTSSKPIGFGNLCDTECTQTLKLISSECTEQTQSMSSFEDCIHLDVSGLTECSLQELLTSHIIQSDATDDSYDHFSTCRDCGSKHDVQKTVEYMKLPEFMVVSIGRGRGGGSRCRVGLNEVIDLSNFIHPNMDNSDVIKLYKLAGVGVLVGEGATAHYMAASVVDNDVYFFNDDYSMKLDNRFNYEYLEHHVNFAIIVRSDCQTINQPHTTLSSSSSAPASFSDSYVSDKQVVVNDDDDDDDDNSDNAESNGSFNSTDNSSTQTQCDSTAQSISCQAHEGNFTDSPKLQLPIFNPIYRCQYCPEKSKPFTKFDALMNHLKDQHRPYMFISNLNSTPFPDDKRVVILLDSEGNLNCPFCVTGVHNVKTYSDMCNHIRRKHNNGLLATRGNDDGSSVTWNPEFLRIVANHPDPDPNRLDECKRNYRRILFKHNYLNIQYLKTWNKVTDYNAYWDKMVPFNNTGGGLCQWDKCGYGAGNGTEMVHHLMWHVFQQLSDFGAREIADCKWNSNSAAGSSKRGGTSKYNIPSDFCRSYKNLPQYVAHVITHAGNLNYCKYCKKTYSSGTPIRSHLDHCKEAPLDVKPNTKSNTSKSGGNNKNKETITTKKVAKSSTKSGLNQSAMSVKTKKDAPKGIKRKAEVRSFPIPVQYIENETIRNQVRLIGVEIFLTNSAIPSYMVHLLGRILNRLLPHKSTTNDLKSLALQNYYESDSNGCLVKSADYNSNNFLLALTDAENEILKKLPMVFRARKAPYYGIIAHDHNARDRFLKDITWGSAQKVETLAALSDSRGIDVRVEPNNGNKQNTFHLSWPQKSEWIDSARQIGLKNLGLDECLKESGDQIFAHIMICRLFPGAPSTSVPNTINREALSTILKTQQGIVDGQLLQYSHPSRMRDRLFKQIRCYAACCVHAEYPEIALDDIEFLIKPAFWSALAEVRAGLSEIKSTGKSKKKDNIEIDDMDAEDAFANEDALAEEEYVDVETLLNPSSSSTTDGNEDDTFEDFGHSLDGEMLDLAAAFDSAYSGMSASFTTSSSTSSSRTAKKKSKAEILAKLPNFIKTRGVCLVILNRRIHQDILKQPFNYKHVPLAQFTHLIIFYARYSLIVGSFHHHGGVYGSPQHKQLGLLRADLMQPSPFPSPARHTEFQRLWPSFTPFARIGNTGNSIRITNAGARDLLKIINEKPADDTLAIDQLLGKNLNKRHKS